MALTSWNDILNKPKGVDSVEELTLTVEQLSASVLSISEDLGEVAEDVQEIVLTIEQLSASNLPYSDTQSTKEAIDEPIVKLNNYSCSSKNIEASGTLWLSFSDFNISAISGYTLVGVVGWHVTGSTFCFIRSMNTRDSSDFISLTNTNNAVQNVIVNVNCLFVKTDKIAQS